MSTYDKSIEISREEEGTYHRREVDYNRPPATTTTTSYPVTTRYIERYQEPSRSRSMASKPQRNSSTKALTQQDSSDEDNFEEWTTSKRKVNHKTRQVETRVSRQLLVRGGEVIADSGPQVTTRIKEDNKVEECEKEKTPKNGKGRFEALENAPEAAEASGLILGEKKEIQRVSREVREENMQYHDERFKELTGKDVHRRAIQAPHELITINDEKAHSSSSKPRGKMVHYSNKGKKYQDTDEILEVAKLAIDGSITKEVKRTKHHEEFSEDELPDEKGEAEQLRRKPVVERSSRRHADYVNDFDQAEEEPGAMQQYDSDRSPDRVSSRVAPSKVMRSRNKASTREEDEAFPRYQIDPLLNSLRDEDFKPLSSTSATYTKPSSRHAADHGNHSSSRRRGQSASSVSSASDVEVDPYNRGSSSRQSRARSPVAVEVPEEYRVNKQKLMSGGRTAGSTLSHKSNRSQAARRREDAATQARLTDEEVERHSLRSSSPGAMKQAHEKTTEYLQRQSTPNSSRHYYYGDAPRGRTGKENRASGKTATVATKRPSSLTSSSSSATSAASSIAQQKRKQAGVQSGRDSGFKSPHSGRDLDTPMSEKIYATSNKSRSRHGAVSPTDSVGQRSVKTTTTTISAGLADRPLAPTRANRKSAGSNDHEQMRSTNKSSRNNGDSQKQRDDQAQQRIKRRQRQATTSDDDNEDDLRSVITITNSKQQQQQPFDTVSLASLRGPKATKIEVPYQRVIEIEREQATHASGGGPRAREHNHQPQHKSSGSSEMSLQEDIESLSKRLASISQRQEVAPQHFDYKTIVANVQPPIQRQPQIERSYNVLIQQQNSPFQQGDQAAHNCERPAPPPQMDNNNESNFSLEQYVKYRATPALVVDQSLQSSAGSTSHQRDVDDLEERMSQNSSACSLQSARTYNIRKLESSSFSKQEPANKQEENIENDAQPQEPEFDENGNGKPAAWIFDPRDNSSTAIVPPARPKQPEAPKIDAKTEELQQARGGRSYYLELVDLSEKRAPNLTKRPQEHNCGSVDSLYSRWNSQGALHQQPALTHRPLASSTRQNLPPRGSQTKLTSVDRTNSNQLRDAKTQQQRRQLPFSGPPASLGDRSKSSSCLLNVTKPSKYSIYGGFRKPGESSKPVPRLSYSRAIGPRSARVDTTPAAPSRYLKMR